MSVVASGWWLPELRRSLSQGDVLGETSFFRGTGVPLEKRPVGVGGTAWFESAKPHVGKDGFGHWLGRARGHAAIVLSHSCDLDRADLRKRNVLLAPIALLSNIQNPQDRENVLAQRTRRSMPLPAVPGLGDCYADLRSALSFDLKVVEEIPRISSMTDDATKRLMLQLIEFFTHVTFQAADMTVPPDD